MASGHETGLRGAQLSPCLLWEEGEEGGQGKNLQVSEWPVILRAGGGLEGRCDGREHGAGSPGFTCSMQDHFDKKEYSWCCTKKKKKTYNQSKMDDSRKGISFCKNSVLPVKWEKIHFFP